MRGLCQPDYEEGVLKWLATKTSLVLYLVGLELFYQSLRYSDSITNSHLYRILIFAIQDLHSLIFLHSEPS